jgi:tetratricopeptide (TPR) repeat protein
MLEPMNDPTNKAPPPSPVAAGGGDRGKATDDGRATFTLDATGAGAAAVVAKLKDNVEYWVARGRYNKVRIKRNGKAVLPDIPVGALFAVEAATFFWTGLLRSAIVNVVGRAFFEVELISDAEDHYKKGLEHFLAGDLKDAERFLDKALEVDSRFVRAHLQMGVLRKMQGRSADARGHFEKVVAWDPRSDAGKEAAVHLKKLNQA